MKYVIISVFLAGLFGSFEGFANPPDGCGKRGDIVWINSPEDIPVNCMRGREDNWVRSAESAPDAKAICKLTSTPSSNDKLIPERNIHDMSACFCGKGLNLYGGVVSLKCWTFFDRTYN